MIGLAAAAVLVREVTEQQFRERPPRVRYRIRPR
jgi:hypothetical protein